MKVTILLEDNRIVALLDCSVGEKKVYNCETKREILTNFRVLLLFVYCLINDETLLIRSTRCWICRDRGKKFSSNLKRTSSGRRGGIVFHLFPEDFRAILQLSNGRWALLRARGANWIKGEIFLPHRCGAAFESCPDE